MYRDYFFCFYLFVLLLVAGCNGTATSSHPLSPITPVGDEAFDHFFEVALQREPRSIVSKWWHDVRVTIDGTPSAADRQTVIETLALFSSLSESVKFRLDSNAPQVHIHFTNRSDFSDYAPVVPSASKGNVTVGICNYKRDPFNSSRKAIIAIDKNRAQAERKVIIQHELMHMIGFGHSQKKDSIIYPTTEGGQRLSALDREAVRILYGSAIQPGMTYPQLRGALGLPQQ